MIEIGLHIKSLLYDHDCVIIPEFGGFVANPHPAKVNKLKSRIEPPFKEIGFNPRLTKNDGLLANYIHDEVDITYENAIHQIGLVVEEIKTTIELGKTYRLDEIGSFYLDSSKSLRFSASNATNFNLDFFGFESIQAKSFTQSDKSNTPKKEVVEPIEVPAKKVIDFESPKTSTKKRKNWVNTAMIAACVPLLLYLLWVPTRIDLQSDRINFQASDLNPYVTPPCPLYEARGNLPAIIQIGKEESNFYKAIATSKKAIIKTSFFDRSDPNYKNNELIAVRVSSYKASPLSTRVAHAFIPPSELQRFYVVAGCFREYSNANSFVNKLRIQGYNSALIDKRGELYRVSIASSNGREEILNLLDKVRTEGHTDAWVLKK